MKNFRLTILCGLCGWALTSQAQVTPVSQMEKLGRGVIALPASSSGKFVSWRLLGTEDVERTTFDVLRDGKVIKADLADVTCYNDAGGNNSSQYQIVTKIDGVVVDTTEAVTPWSN